MDSSRWGLSGSMNGCKFNHGSVSTCSDPNIIAGYDLDDASLYYDVKGLPITPGVPDIWSSPYSSISPKGNICGAVLKYINQVLMEDDVEDKVCMIQDASLNAAEQSFYDVLYNRQPFSAAVPLVHPDESVNSSGVTDFVGSHSNRYTESGIGSDLNPCKSSHAWIPQTVDGMPKSHASMLSKSESSSLSNARIEEDSEILAKADCRVFYDKNRSVPLEAREEVFEVEVMAERDERELSPDSLLRIRKPLHREEGNDLDNGRRSKHLAAHAEESILHEMFDKMLVLWGGNHDAVSSDSSGASINGMNEDLLQNEKAKAYNVKTIFSRKGVSKREAVDTRSLLIQCVQSLACNDQRGATKLLKQIRLRSSPTGDGTQRLAYYFANALEARLAGSGFPVYKAVAEKDKTFSDTVVLKAMELFLSDFPFVMTSYHFASEMILDLAENATSIHILHFGIMHGLQWLPFIQRLSARPGGPPKLRVTGIDVPQAGFRPAARVEETGRRLASYCERFGVPFEYNAIAAKWETLSVLGLKIKEDEMVVVNCLYQFMYLHDDTVSEDSPRDAVLKLIRRINPDIFIHGIVNGAFCSPFFITRFREALFHFSAFFDMYDAIVDRDNQERMVLEREILGQEILNVIACEGLERIERPETYKQWHARTLRADFTQLPLSQEIMKKLRSLVKSQYHKDFLVEDSNQWVLQGWKGRALFAISCWKPA